MEENVTSTKDFEPLVKSQETPSQFVLRNVHIFNGKDDEVQRNQDVLISNGCIQEIGPSGTISAKFPEIVDAREMTLMPGLIDSHVHVTGSGSVPWKNVKGRLNYNLEAYLYAGITTVYDLGGIAKSLRKLSRNIDKGTILGPSLYHTHIPITVKNSHPIPLAKIMLPRFLGFMANIVFPTISKVDQAAKIINRIKKKGVNYIKISCDEIPPGSPEMPTNILKTLVTETHRAGLKAFVHIGSVDNALAAVEAGADILAHGIWRKELSEQQAEDIVASGVKIIYTLAGFLNVDRINRGEFSPNDIERKLIPCCVLDPVSHEKGKDVKNQRVMSEFFDDVSENSSYVEKNFRLLHEKGAPIFVGTDSNLPGTYAGATYYQELYELHKFGMSATEVLKAATYGNAHLFMDQPDFGVISEGAKADLLLFRNSPLEDLRAIEEPSFIFKRGKLIQRLR